MTKQPATYSLWMFSLVASSLTKNAEPQAFIKFLDEEVARAEQKSKAAAASRIGFSRGQSETLVQPIAFPPNQFVSFPSTIVSLIGFDAEDADIYGINDFGDSDAESPEQWAKRYAPVVDSAKDPVLKLLLLTKLAEADIASGKSEVELYASVQQQIDDLLKAEKPNADVYLLAAGLANKLEQWDKASELLEKLRNLPMSRSMRQVVDGGLVAIAIEGVGSDFEAAENAKVVSSAKAAALRLRRGRLPAEKRLQLVAVLETLGLNKEAEKVESKLTQSNATFSGFGSSFGSSGRGTSTPTKRIRELIRSGKTEAAIRLLANELKGKMQYVFDVDNLTYGDYESQEFIQRIRSLGVKDEFLTYLDPKESKSPNKLQIYGYALERFGNKEEAIRVYSEILKTRKRNQGVRARLMLLQLEDGQDVSQHFTEVNSTVFNGLRSAISERVRENKIKFDLVLDFLSSIHRFATENIDGEDDLTWLVPILNWTADSHDIGNSNYLPSLTTYVDKRSYDETQFRRKRSKERFKKFIARRGEIHEKLCQALLTIPQTRGAAFTAQLRVAEAAGETDFSRFVPIATESVLQVIPKKKSGNRRYSQSFRVNATFSASYDGDFGDKPPLRSPLEFLARHYGMQSANPSRSSELASLYAQLEQQEKTNEINQLKQLVGLYSASDEEFVSAAESYLKFSKQLQRKTRNVQPGSEMSKVVEVWADTRKELNLDEFVLTNLPENTQGYGFYGAAPSFLTQYSLHLFEQNQSERIRGLLQDYSVRLLGPLESQPEIFEKAGNRRGFSRNQAKGQLYTQLLQQIGENQKLSLLAAAEFHRIGIGIDNMNSEYYVSQQLTSFENAEELIDWLEFAPFMNAVDSFDPWVEKSAGESKTVWGAIVKQIVYDEGKCIKELEKLWSKRQDLTFGQEVLLMALRGHNNRNGLTGLMNAAGKRLDKIKALPQDQLQNLAEFVIDVVDSDQLSYARRDGPELTKAAKEVETIFRSAMSGSGSSDLQRLMAANRISDLKIDEYRFQDWTKRLLMRLDRSDPAAWIAAFNKSLALTKKSSRSPYYQYSGDERSLVDNLFSEIIQNRLDYDWLRIYHDLLQEDSEIKFTANESLSEIGEFFENRLSVQKTSNRKRATQLQRVQSLYNELGREFDGRDTSVLIVPLSGMFSSSQFKKLEKLTIWADQQVDGGKFKDLASDMKIAIDLAKSSKQTAKIGKKMRKDPLLPPPDRLTEIQSHQKQLNELLNGTELTTRSKLALASAWVQYDSFMPAECVAQCAQIFGDAYDLGLNVKADSVALLMGVINDIEFKDSFVERVKPFAEAWRKAKLQKRNSQQRGYHSTSYFYSESVSFLAQSQFVEAISIFAKLGDLATVEKILRRYADKLNDRRAIVRLIESGLHTQAKRICVRLFAQPDSINYGLGNPAFSQELETQSPEFIALFGNDGTKFLAEVFLASLHDKKRPQHKPSQTRQQRLNDLVAKYEDVEFGSQIDNQIAIILLSDAEAASQPISAAFREAAADIKTVDLWDSNHREQYGHNRTLYSSWLKDELKQNNVDSVVAGVEMLLANKPEEDDWSYRNMVSSVVGSLHAPLKSQLKKSSPGQVRDLLPIFRKFGHPDLSTYNSEISTIAIAAHVIADAVDQQMKWLEELKQEALKAKQQDSEDGIANEVFGDDEDNGDDPDEIVIFKNSDLDDCWPLLAEYFADRDQFKNRDGRLEIVKRMWTVAAAAKMDVGSGHFQSGVQESCSGCRDSKMGLDAITDANILNAEEIAAHGASLAESLSVNGEIWRQVAREQIALGQFEQAAIAMKAALADCKKEMEQAKINRSVEYAFVLSELNRDEEARKWLADVKTSKLLGDNVKRYDKLNAKYGEN